MPDKERQITGKITTIFEVTDPDLAARRPFCLAIDQISDPYGRFITPTGHKVLISAAVRAQLAEGDTVTLVVRDADWNPEFVGLWKDGRKLAGPESA